MKFVKEFAAESVDAQSGCPLPIARPAEVEFRALGGGAAKNLAYKASQGAQDKGIWVPNTAEDLDELQCNEIDDRIGERLESISEDDWNNRRKRIVDLRLGAANA